MTSKNLDILNICIIILAILVIFCLVYQNHNIESFKIMDTKKNDKDFTPEYIHGDSVRGEDCGLPLIFLVNKDVTASGQRNFIKNDLTYLTLNSYDKKLPEEDIINYVFGINLNRNTNKISLRTIKGQKINNDLENIHLIPTRLNNAEPSKYFKIRKNDLLEFLELKNAPKEVKFTDYKTLSEPWKYKFYFIPYYCTTDLSKAKVDKNEGYKLLQKKNFCITQEQENSFRDRNKFK